MGHSAQDQPPSGGSDFAFRLFTSLILDGHSAAVTLPIRTREGIRGFALHGLFAIVVTFGWAALYPCPPLLYYAAFLAVLLPIKRLTSLLRHHFGARQVSQYPGYPSLVLLLAPFASEGFAKTVLEPLLIAGIGVYAKGYSRGVGLFLLTGAAFTAFRYGMAAARTAASDLAEEDAHAMARQRSDRKQKRGRMV